MEHDHAAAGLAGWQGLDWILRVEVMGFCGSDWEPVFGEDGTPSPLARYFLQPLFYFSLTAMVLGVQLFIAGFLGELINRRSSDRNHYLIDEKIE